ncbi:transposase [Sphingomonas sp. SORGH_AS 950]|nr:transposase [Sphingomonas sp. SORGH_AS_0950]
MGAALDLPATISLSPTRMRLADFLRRRRHLIEMRKAEKLHRHSAGQPEIAQAIKSMITLLGQQIADLDRQIAGFIAQDPALSEQDRLLNAVPGIGPTVVATLLGEPLELGTLCRRKIASLAGLAPHARQSGTWRGARRIWGGGRKVGEALYIAVLNALRRIPVLTSMRDRMRAKGKAPKTILIAVARQLFVILNAMIRKRQTIALTRASQLPPEMLRSTSQPLATMQTNQKLL